MRALEILNYLLEEDNCTDFTSGYIQKAIDELEKQPFNKKIVSFDVLWDSTISGYAISENEDIEEFTKRISKKTYDYVAFLKYEA